MALAARHWQGPSFFAYQYVPGVSDVPLLGVKNICADHKWNSFHNVKT
jgi:hypothetical protein